MDDIVLDPIRLLVFSYAHKSFYFEHKHHNQTPELLGECLVDLKQVMNMYVAKLGYTLFTFN